ncbi:ATP-binding protein [Candidatus Margulisiibacteriota bacterium]
MAQSQAQAIAKPQRWPGLRSTLSRMRQASRRIVRTGHQVLVSPVNTAINFIRPAENSYGYFSRFRDVIASVAHRTSRVLGLAGAGMLIPTGVHGLVNDLVLTTSDLTEFGILGFVFGLSAELGLGAYSKLRAENAVVRAALAEKESVLAQRERDLAEVRKAVIELQAEIETARKSAEKAGFVELETLFHHGLKNLTLELSGGVRQIREIETSLQAEMLRLERAGNVESLAGLRASVSSIFERVARLEASAEAMKDTEVGMVNLLRGDMEGMGVSNLYSQAQTVLNQVANMAREAHGVNVDIYFERAGVEESAGVPLAPHVLREVLINLVYNAVQALRRAGSANTDIVISVETIPEQEVRFSVRDFGPGMTPEVLARVRAGAEGTTMEAEGGSGIGLSTSQRIVRSVGGRMEFYSTRDYGATAVAVLPLVESRVVEKQEAPKVLKQVPVVIVDDQPLALIDLEAVLGGFGFTEIIGCSSPDEVIRYFEGANGRQHVLIADQNMPKMEGVELIQRVRVLSPNTRSILNTGEVRLSTTLANALARNGARQVAKGNEGELLQAISAALSDSLASHPSEAQPSLS